MTTTPQQTWPTTAFIGVGAMGEPMASRLAAAGVPLLLADADSDRASALAASIGAQAVSGPDQYRDVDVVILMLPDSAAVEDAVTAQPGLAARLRPGTLVVDMGSSDPPRTVKVAAELARRDIALVDAPVSGGTGKARTGELAIMAGGDDAAVSRALPLLELMGARITRTGPVGSGHAMKALNNLLSAIGLLGASEVLTVGAKFGLTPSVMLEVLNNSTGRNHATENKCAQYVLSRAFNSGFAMRLMVKDLGIATSLAASLGTSTSLVEACEQAWRQALEKLGSGADHTEIARFVEAANDVELG